MQDFSRSIRNSLESNPADSRTVFLCSDDHEGFSLYAAGEEDAFVLALNAASGAPVSGFGSGGIQTAARSQRELACRIAVFGPTIYVAGGFSSNDAGIGGVGEFKARGFGGFLIPPDGATGRMSAPVITSKTTDQATVGVAYIHTLTAMGTKPITYSAASLPDGLSLVGTVISGTPTRAGAFSIVLTAQNVFGTATQTLVLSILHGPGNTAPTITSIPVASPNHVMVGQAITLIAAATDAEGDVLTYRWDFGDGTTGTGVP